MEAATDTSLVLGVLQPQPKIREALDARGWPGTELAKRAGITGTTLNRWIRGETKPRTAGAEAICEALDMEWSELLTYERPTTAKAAN